MRAAGTLRAGVPTQPMLAKPSTSVDDAILRLSSLRLGVTAQAESGAAVHGSGTGAGGGAGGGGCDCKASGNGAAAATADVAAAAAQPALSVRLTAENKYDGQRAQLHRTSAGKITLFSRKNDCMTSKCVSMPYSPRAPLQLQHCVSQWARVELDSRCAMIRAHSIPL